MYKRMYNIVAFEEQNHSIMITDLAMILLNEYEKNTARGLLYKKATYVSSLANILGNLFIRNGKSKADKKYTAQVIIPTGNGIYYKNSREKEIQKLKDTNKLENNDRIEQLKVFSDSNEILQLTKDKRNLLIEVLEYNGICSLIKGERNGKCSTLNLRNPNEWTKGIFHQTIEQNLLLYEIVNGGYFDRLVYENYKEDCKPAAYINIKDSLGNIVNFEPASRGRIKHVEQINSMWPNELVSYYKYHRVFTTYETDGGRFYGSFPSMSKSYRKAFILDPFHYVEVDFSAFVPNAMKQFTNSEYFTERPYNKVAKTLIISKNKGRKQKYSTDNDFINTIANCIKRVILILLNNDRIDNSTINKLKNNPEANRILVEVGLYNTIQEFLLVKKSCKNNFRERENLLYLYRKERWNSDNGIECPRFKVSPANVATAIKKGAPELKSFLFLSTWGWTQLLESELLIDLAEEMRKDKLLPLFIHDSIVVPKELEEKYRALSKSLLIKIVEDFKTTILVPENIDLFLSAYSELVLSVISSERLNMLIELNRNNKLKIIDIKKQTNYIIRTLENCNSFIDFMRNDYNQLIYPCIIKDRKDQYRLIKEIIIRKIKG